MEIFQEFDFLLRVFWYIAIPISAIFIIQAIMTFFGGDSADDFDADFDGDTGMGFHLFSFRNLVNFLLGFSWGGISLYSTISNQSLLLFVSIVIGVLFVSLFFVIISQLKKLSEDNSFRINDTLGKSADVYLTIPQQMSGKGKVHVSVKGSLRELKAMTEGDELKSGSPVKVVRIENDGILIVESI